jgi:HlyD family secretion protein
MPTELLPNLLMLGGLVGFIVFAFLHAVGVWKHRHKATMSGQVSLPSLARQWLSWGFMLAGTVVLIASFVWQEFMVREGLLSGDGLFAVRARDGWMLDFLYRGESAEAGQVLARLRSPEREAELQVLKWRRAALEARQKMLSKQPLELDPEIVRRFQEAAADQQQLRAFLTQLTSEHRLVTRDLLAEHLAKQEKHQQLHTEIAQLEHELTQAQAKHQFSAHHTQRLEALLKRHLASPSELEKQQTELAVFTAQVANLQARLQRKQAEQRLLVDDIAQLQALRTTQSQQLVGEIERTRMEMGDATQAMHDFETQLAKDLKRATLVQERQLEAVELELRQVEAQLQGLAATLQVRAPFAGHVVYRDLSPNAASDATTVLVLAPPAGFDLRLRLPASELQALAHAGPVTLELLEPAVQRRFQGTLVRWQPLPDDPRFVLAELQCQPPAQAIRQLASNENVAARLVWRPPLYTAALFPLAAGAVVLGGIGLALPWTHRGRQARHRMAAPAQAGTHEKDASPGIQERESPTPHPMPIMMGGTASDTGLPGHPDEAHLSYGVLSGILQTLAYRLRESVVYDNLDAALLTAIEWNLDRHHTRAVAVLNEVLQEDAEFLKHAQRVLYKLATAATSSTDVQAQGLLRFERVLRIIDPQLVNRASQDGVAYKVMI